MNDLVERLISGRGWKRGQPGSIDAPQFNNAGRVHDWRNHVPAEVKAVWLELDDVARAVAFVIADNAASAEEWD